MRRIVLVLTLIVAVAAPAWAETSRWQLGNPSLVIDLPAEPHGGGVAWHEELGVLPTSWSSESEDVKVEVAESFGDQSPLQLADRLAVKTSRGISGGKAGQVSGQPSLMFQVGGSSGLTVGAQGRGWTVLVTPKTSVGSGMVSGILGSIVLERWGPPRWVRRSLGKTRLNSELPYELSPEGAGTDGIPGFELHFSDFVVTASVASPGEGHTIDYEGTVKEAPALEKGRPGTTDFTSKTEKFERDGFKAYVVTMTFKRGSKAYVLTEFFTMDEGRLLRVNMNGRQGNAEHEVWASRIVDTVKVSSVDLAAFAPQRLGDEGVWFDAPKPFTGPTASGTVRTYGVDFGAFGCDVRVVDTGDAPQDLDQLMTFAEAKFKPADEVKDYSANVTRKFVDGMESRVLRVQYRRKGRGDLEIRSAIALGLPDRLVILEVIANEAQSPYIDRVIETARVEIQVPTGWKRYPFGSHGLSFLFGTEPDKPETGDRYGARALATVLSDPELIAEVYELQYDDTAPVPGILLQSLFKDLKAAVKSEGKIAEQRPYGLGGRTGVYATLEFEHPQAGKVSVDLIVVKQGSVAHAIVVLPTSRSASARAKRAAFLNSLR